MDFLLNFLIGTSKLQTCIFKAFLRTKEYFTKHPRFLIAIFQRTPSYSDRIKLHRRNTICHIEILMLLFFFEHIFFSIFHIIDLIFQLLFCHHLFARKIKQLAEFFWIFSGLLIVIFNLNLVHKFTHRFILEHLNLWLLLLLLLPLLLLAMHIQQLPGELLSS